MSGPSPEHRAFVEAGIGIVQAVVMADNTYSQAEVNLFVKAQHGFTLFSDVPADAFNDMLGRVRARLAAEPWKALVTEWATAVPQPHRMAIFKLAVDVATVDKGIEGREPEVIRHLAGAFGLPEAEARLIFAEKIEKM